MLEHLVVDSGAIIKGCGFDFHKTAKRYEENDMNHCSQLPAHCPFSLISLLLVTCFDRFWTVQDVINEIRDKKSLHLLETLPFELEIRYVLDYDIDLLSPTYSCLFSSSSVIGYHLMQPCVQSLTFHVKRVTSLR